jgi:hypothetical protein
VSFIGVHPIRHYGLFANGNRAANIARAREFGRSFFPPPRWSLVHSMQLRDKGPINDASFWACPESILIEVSAALSLAAFPASRYP